MTRTGIVNGRFQVLHLKHMEYILAAKMRCDKLYIGITNPDGAHTRDTVQIRFDGIPFPALPRYNFPFSAPD